MNRMSSSGTDGKDGMIRVVEWKKTGDKDKGKAKFDIKIRSTHHLIELIKQGKLPDKIMLNAHPQRWNDEFLPWVSELVSQNIKNVVKRIIIHRLR